MRINGGRSTPATRQLKTVLWMVEGDLTDNIAEIQDFLEPFEARCKRFGDNLLLQGWGGMNTELAPGDCLVLDGNRLGIFRTAVPGTPAQIAPDS